MDWDALRRAEFPVAERWAYFDHAAVAPLPRRSGDALRAWADEQEQQRRRPLARLGARSSRRSRDRVARLINAEPDEIAFVGSTTHGHRPGRRGVPLARRATASSRPPRSIPRTSIPG